MKIVFGIFLIITSLSLIGCSFWLVLIGGNNGYIVVTTVLSVYIAILASDAFDEAKQAKDFRKKVWGAD